MGFLHYKKYTKSTVILLILLFDKEREELLLKCPYPCLPVVLSYPFEAQWGSFPFAHLSSISRETEAVYPLLGALSILAFYPYPPHLSLHHSLFLTSAAQQDETSSL